MYTAGIIGLNLDSTIELFKSLTPFNLLFSTFVLIYFHLDKSKSFIFFVIVTFMIGYWIEVVGVNTGLIFGEYEYVSTLGFEVLNVPLTIGINWLIVAYCSGHLIHKINVPKIVQVVLAALLMTAFDYVVEPIAIRLDMWSWFGKEPPLSNYAGWFITSFVIQIIYFYAPFKKENPVAVWLFALQALFFGIQWLL
jgi:putative membrane protein